MQSLNNRFIEKLEIKEGIKITRDGIRYTDNFTGKDTYFQVNRATKKRGKLSDTDIDEVRAIYFDIDSVQESKLFLAEHKDALIEMGFTDIVFSGRGIHLYSVFTKPIDYQGDNKEHYDYLRQAFADRLTEYGIVFDKKVRDVSRLLRMPGSINGKNDKGCEVEVSLPSVSFYELLDLYASRIKALRENKRLQKKYNETLGTFVYSHTDGITSVKYQIPFVQVDVSNVRQCIESSSDGSRNSFFFNYAVYLQKCKLPIGEAFTKCTELLSAVQYKDHEYTENELDNVVLYVYRIERKPFKIYSERVVKSYLGQVEEIVNKELKNTKKNLGELIDQIGKVITHFVVRYGTRFNAGCEQVSEVILGKKDKTFGSRLLKIMMQSGIIERRLLGNNLKGLVSRYELKLSNPFDKRFLQDGRRNAPIFAVQYTEFHEFLVKPKEIINMAKIKKTVTPTIIEEIFEPEPSMFSDYLKGQDFLEEEKPFTIVSGGDGIEELDNDIDLPSEFSFLVRPDPQKELVSQAERAIHAAAEHKILIQEDYNEKVKANLAKTEKEVMLETQMLAMQQQIAMLSKQISDLTGTLLRETGSGNVQLTAAGKKLIVKPEETIVDIESIQPPNPMEQLSEIDKGIVIGQNTYYIPGSVVWNEKKGYNEYKISDGWFNQGGALISLEQAMIPHGTLNSVGTLRWDNELISWVPRDLFEECDQRWLEQHQKEDKFSQQYPMRSLDEIFDDYEFKTFQVELTEVQTILPHIEMGKIFEDGTYFGNHQLRSNYFDTTGKPASIEKVEIQQRKVSWGKHDTYVYVRGLYPKTSQNWNDFILPKDLLGCIETYQFWIFRLPQLPVEYRNLLKGIWLQFGNVHGVEIEDFDAFLEKQLKEYGK